MSAQLLSARAGSLRRRAVGSPFLLPLTDLATLLFCFTLGGVINFSYENVTQERGAILLLLGAGAIVLFQQLGHYARRRQFWQEVGDIIVIASVFFLLDAALLYLLKVRFSRAWVLTSWLLVMVSLPVVRRGVRLVGTRLGSWKQPTVILGTGPIARETAEAYARDPHLGYEVIAFVDPASDPDDWQEIDLLGRKVPVLPLEPGAPTLPPWLGRPHVVVSLELDELPGREGLIEKLSLYHGDIDVISPVRGLPISNAKASHFFTHDILSLRISNNLARPTSQLLKRLFDILAASTLLVLVAPLMALITVKLRLVDRGTVLFAHTRVGRHGQLFQCLKFRSMVPNAKDALEKLLAADPVARAEWNKDFKLKNDPRITPWGRFLRRTSLDELPQLINVIKGEMSLVGPRPVILDELDRYGDARVYYLQVRPGLTGLWQISGRNDIDYARRISLDTWYVRNWTLWYDVLILFKTAMVVPTKGAGAY